MNNQYSSTQKIDPKLAIHILIGNCSWFKWDNIFNGGGGWHKIFKIGRDSPSWALSIKYLFKIFKIVLRHKGIWPTDKAI